jgi:hypothetical protein
MHRSLGLKYRYRAVRSSQVTTINAPWGYLMTTSPGGECGSGLGSLGVGDHLLAMPVTELKVERSSVARRDILEKIVRTENCRARPNLPILVVNRQTQQSSTHQRPHVGQHGQRPKSLYGRTRPVILCHTHTCNGVGGQFVASV